MNTLKNRVPNSGMVADLWKTEVIREVRWAILLRRIWFNLRLLMKTVACTVDKLAKIFDQIFEVGNASKREFRNETQCLKRSKVILSKLIN